MTRHRNVPAWLAGLSLALVPALPALAAGADGDRIIDRGRPGVRPAPKKRPVVKARPPTAAAPEAIQPFVLTLGSGIDGLGARAPAPGSADLDFLKAGLAGEYARDLGVNHWLSLGFTGQASGDRLPTSEQFVLGGSDYGRAYPSALLSGDQGVAVKAELGWRPGKLLPKPIAGSEVYGFVDRGWVSTKSRPGVPGGDAELGSAGAGVRFNLGKRVTLELEGARAIDDPRPRPGADGRAANFGLTVRY